MACCSIAGAGCVTDWMRCFHVFFWRTFATARASGPQIQPPIYALSGKRLSSGPASGPRSVFRGGRDGRHPATSTTLCILSPGSWTASASASAIALTEAADWEALDTRVGPNRPEGPPRFRQRSCASPSGADCACPCHSCRRGAAVRACQARADRRPGRPLCSLPPYGFCWHAGASSSSGHGSRCQNRSCERPSGPKDASCRSSV